MKYLIIFMLFSCPLFGQTYHIGDSIGAPSNNNEYIKIRNEFVSFKLKNFHNDYYYGVIRSKYESELYTYMVAIKIMDTIEAFKIEIDTDHNIITIYEYIALVDRFKNEPSYSYNYFARTWN